MKRVIVLLVVLSISITMFAMPVFADDSIYGNWVNAFDYWNYNDAGLTYTYYESLNDYYVSFNQNLTIYSFDIVFSVVGEAPQFMTFRTTSGVFASSHLIEIGDNIYRFYGNFENPAPLQNYWLRFFGSGEIATYVTFHSFMINTAPSSSFDIECYCDILSYGYGNTIHYVPSDEINHREWIASDNYENPFLQIDLYSEDWKKYDYIDYYLTMTCGAVTSISCTFDGAAIPFVADFTDNYSVGAKTFTILIRIDLTGIDRSIDSFPNVHIEGQQLPGESNIIGVLSCVGGIYIDNQNGISYYVNRILSNLSQMLSRAFSIDGNISSILKFLKQSSPEAEQLEQDVATKDEQLGSLIDDMNSVTRPAIDSVNSDVSGIVSSDDLVLASQGLGALMNNEIIFSVFSMSLILCLASYVFFGKK